MKNFMEVLLWLAEYIFSVHKMRRTSQKKTLYVALQTQDNNVFIIIIMEQLPLNLQSHLCQLGFVLLRELVGAPFTNGDEPF